uniref:Fibronectin type-III domain-containing protein n=1 Tax=Salvator merianae TaxID=96440 RepID=A0A8D0E3R7_SALMN
MFCTTRKVIILCSLPVKLISIASFYCDRGRDFATTVDYLFSQNGLHNTEMLMLLCCRGGMNASAEKMSRGSTVTLSCRLKNSRFCNNISIFQNGSKILNSYSLSASTHVRLNVFGAQKFICKCLKQNLWIHICGFYVFVGSPPDKPKNVICIQHGLNGNTSCSWEKGNYTYLDTNYTLQSCSIHDLNPYTEYKFQVSCRFLPNSSVWSDWSNLVHTEAGNTLSDYEAYTRHEGRDLLWINILYLPPPCHLSAASVGNGSMLVSWKAPLTPPINVNGYIVEWAELGHNSSEIHPAWLRIPGFNFTAVVSKCTKNLKHNVCYCFSVFALYQSKRLGNHLESWFLFFAAPLTGPQIKASENKGSIFVFWTEIPDDQQMGCIVGFRLYENSSIYFFLPCDLILDIPRRAPQPFVINNVELGTTYALWMTASTKAGESPKGNEEAVYMKG